MAEIDYDALDWSQLMTPNINKLPPKKDPRTEYKEVYRYPEYYPEAYPNADINKVLKYIAMVYDAKSPLHGVINDLRKVKMVAAELAGFIMQEDGKFLANVMQVLACRDAIANQMIVRYVVTNKSGLFSKFILYTELHSGLMNRLLGGEKADIKEFDLLSDKLDSVRQEMFRKDQSKDLEALISEFYFSEKLKLRPEDIAKRIKQGEVPVAVPEKKKPRRSRAESLNPISPQMNTAS